MQDKDENKKNPEFYRISCIYKKLLPQKPLSQRLDSGAKGRIERGFAFWPQTVTNKNKWRLIVENIIPKSYYSYFEANHVISVFRMYKKYPKIAVMALKFDH